MQKVLVSRVSDPAELDELEDDVLLRMLRSLPRTSVRRTRACELLVSRYRNLVWSCVRHYQNGPESTEDLMQVGYVGLMKAVNNFDPAVGASLAAYARPCITGEIKRHFRDKRWQIHVKRPMQELVLEARNAAGKLNQQLGRPPTDAELARALGTDEQTIRQARTAEIALAPLSLDAPMTGEPDAATLGDMLGEHDRNLELAIDLQAVAAHWDELPERERRILVMRFYHDMTQDEIGAHIGVSQMQVSRLLAHALGYLRQRILGSDEAAAA